MRESRRRERFSFVLWIPAFAGMSGEGIKKGRIEKMRPLVFQEDDQIPAPSISGMRLWMPHSVFSLSAQRPARAESPGLVRRVQGMQPSEVKPWPASGWRGRFQLLNSLRDFGWGDARQRIELQPRALDFHGGNTAALAALITLASVDPGVEVVEHFAQRLDLAQIAAGVWISGPEVARRILLRQCRRPMA